MDLVSRVALVDISDHLLVICMLDRQISSCHKNYILVMTIILWTNILDIRCQCWLLVPYHRYSESTITVFMNKLYQSSHTNLLRNR